MLHANHLGDVPRIVTPLPGPRAKALVERDERYTSPSYTRPYPLAIARASGAIVEDLDGNRFLDFNAGIAVCSTGHCHERVVRAIQQQADRLIHMSGTDFYYEPLADLSEKLATIAPGDKPKRVFLTNSGTESVEGAFKLARYRTQRDKVIAFYGAFHGRTYGSMSLTASRTIQRRGYAPLVPGVVHIDYPNVYRNPREALADGSHHLYMLDELEHKLFKRTLPPDEVAAVFVEPIQGEGGYIVPPDNFFPRLREICDRHGILLVADEVQSGFGRTGKMFAMNHWNVAPDILCLAKGIGSGMPIGAIVAAEDIMTWPPGAHANTYGGNPLACVAALETIALLEEGLIENSRSVGEHLMAGAQRLAEKHKLIGHVRGKGLMIGVELVTDRTTKEPAIKQRDALVQACFERGLLLLGCGDSSIRFCPPLIITKSQADTALEIMDKAFDGIS